MEKFENTYVYYTRVAEPKKAMDEGKPDYFSTSLLVTKAQKKAFNARFPKNKIKEYSTAEFEQQFKVSPPEEFVTGDDEVFVLELKKKAVYSDGNPLKAEHRPKVFIKNAAGKLEDSTSTLLGNSTKASVSWSEYEVKAGKFPGVYPQLGNILVHNLVPYAGKANDAGSEFGEVEGNGNEFAESAQSAPTSPAKASAPAPKVAPKKATKPVVEESDDDSSPF